MFQLQNSSRISLNAKWVWGLLLFLFICSTSLVMCCEDSEHSDSSLRVSLKSAQFMRCIVWRHTQTQTWSLCSEILQSSFSHPVTKTSKGNWQEVCSGPHNCPSRRPGSPAPLLKVILPPLLILSFLSAVTFLSFNSAPLLSDPQQAEVERRLIWLRKRLNGATSESLKWVTSSLLCSSSTAW